MANKTSLVIVESPTKAKTIRKFLPSNFVVEASMGHLRDLPQSTADIPAALKGEEWTKLGVNVEKGFEPLYIIPKGKKKVVQNLKKLLKDAEIVYLATDEDREGESISWHLIELLQPKVPVKRMVFHEITKKAIQAALQDCRDLDVNLVKAQEARRVLDRIYGYTLSPLLWKKISYGLSAGRVQSSGLRMIAQRERERMLFKKAEYWDLKAELNKDKAVFPAVLSQVEGKKIPAGKDFDEHTGKVKAGKDVCVLTEQQAHALKEKVEKESWKVIKITDKQSTSRPPIPFITSTLQQDGNRKLGMSAKEVMRTAQRLYEEGLITYMRTDSPNLSGQAIQAAREQIQELYGKDYLAATARQFKSKSKGAQEAHEAIRPAGESFQHPRDAKLSGRELAVYRLIWERTLACQMAEAKKSSQSIQIQAGETIFQANGTKILFPGYLRVYVEGKDDPDAALENKEVILPALTEGETVTLKSVLPVYHETKPPPRYSEAALVQNLEKEGIGRPSTYATIIGTIQDRGYVKKEGNALVPSFTGLAVIQLLERHFANLVDYKFTSEMEEALDGIAYEGLDSTAYLKKFYSGKKGLKNRVEENEKTIKPDESRTIDLPHLETPVKVGRYGPYVISAKEGREEIHASLPEEMAPADVQEVDIQELLEASKDGPKPIGKHPDTGENIYCLTGRYGAYLQLGEKTDEVPKPKRASLPKPLTPKTVSLEQAVQLLRLPRELGEHPEKKKPVMAALGRFGPYVGCDGDFRSLKKEDDVYTVTLERALELLAQPKGVRRGSKAISDLGEHPKKKKKIGLFEGKYGPYLKMGTKNFGLPDELKKDEAKWKKLTLAEAVKIIDETAKK